MTSWEVDVVGPKTTNGEKDPKDFLVSPSAQIDIRQYKPEVDANGTWWVSEIDSEFMATGNSVLACGGGGPGYVSFFSPLYHMNTACPGHPANQCSG